MITVTEILILAYLLIDCCVDGHVTLDDTQQDADNNDSGTGTYIAQSVQRLATGWTTEGSEFEPR
jgi:hypothetical protein